MKRFRNVFLTILASLVVAMPAVALADVNFGDMLPNFREPFGASGTLLGVVGAAITLIFGVAGLVAVVYLIIGGFNYVTAGGDPEAVQMAKTTIVNSIIGLLVILASYLIVQFILNALDVTTEIPGQTGF